MRKPLENRFSWSKSRIEVFDRCLREYFWTYYGSWGGWLRSAPIATRQAYLLKKLDNRWGWSGKIVHTFIREYLLALLKGFTRPREQLLEHAKLLMRADLQYSAALSFQDGDKRRGDFTGLLEHYYDEKQPKEEWAAMWSRTEQALLGFLDGRWPKDVAAMPGEVLELDDSMEPVMHLGIALHSRPDLAFRSSGIVSAVDWKTGEPAPGDEDQVAGQIRHLEAKGIDGEKRGWLVYLREGIEREVRVSPEDLKAFDARFIAGAAAMKHLLVDVETNTPKPIDEFRMTDDLHKCATCRFRRLCGREQASKEAA